MPRRFDDLIARLAEHDNEAFEIIHSETKKMVFAIIYPLVGDLGLTEDLMQDTYIRMLRNLESFDRRRPFGPWLAQIAKNIAYDHLRHAKREKLAHEAAWHIQAPKPEHDIDIDKLIRTLDREKQAIVLMRIVGDMSFKAIASTLERPLGTIYSIYKTAIRELRQKIGKEDNS
mgnify:CR=1 FL=1